MGPHVARSVAHLALAFALCTGASITHAQVYKCKDDTGKTTYSDAPCDATNKPLKLPADPKANASDPNMCAQLQDETSRLAAQADRDARQGRRETAASAKRRQALTGQYEARCVGISRSEPRQK